MDRTVKTWVKPRARVKPRTRFCWDCSRKLQGNYHVQIEFHEDPGVFFIMHIDCANRYPKKIEG